VLWHVLRYCSDIWRMWLWHVLRCRLDIWLRRLWPVLKYFSDIWLQRLWHVLKYLLDLWLERLWYILTHFSSISLKRRSEMKQPTCQPGTYRPRKKNFYRKSMAVSSEQECYYNSNCAAVNKSSIVTVTVIAVVTVNTTGSHLVSTSALCFKMIVWSLMWRC